MKTALRPNFVSMTGKNKEITTITSHVSDDERDLYALSESRGWKILEQFIQGQSEGLEELNAGAMEKGMSFEEIGRNAVVVNMSRSVIKRILDKVKDAREAVEKINE